MTDRECLNSNYCHCSVCEIKLKQKETDYRQSTEQKNCLEIFLKDIPNNFPLGVVSTTFCKQDNLNHHYYNGNKIQNKKYVFCTKTKKVIGNFPLSANILMYFQMGSKLIPKFQISSYLNESLQQTKQNQSHESQNPSRTSKRHQKPLYIQAYSPLVPIKVHFKKSQSHKHLDNLLRQYLVIQKKNFSKKKDYQINQEFWQWIFTDYGEDAFAYFLTEFYCNVYNFYTENIIHEAFFYWVFQKLYNQLEDNSKIVHSGRKQGKSQNEEYFIVKAKRLNFKIKLVNVRNAQIEYWKNLYSFQDEYQKIIIQKVNNFPKSSKIQQNKNYIYKNRLNSFQSKIRDIFLQQQNSVLKQVQTEKQFQTKQDSNKLARLLLPSMGEHQTIRQILNDQFAFQKLILFQKKKQQAERLRKARISLLGKKHLDDSLKKYDQISKISKETFRRHQMGREAIDYNTRRRRIKTQI